ncbi:MAG: clan AA aspartic protease [Candidatus Verstraetearchaeota archaeon]|jgi:clan AA aspartic protease|nr:clan AA aspartic protease [Candidatus Verstraetearchaeota archaeon]
MFWWLAVGYVWVDAIIRNSITNRSAFVKALVDTGATYTVIPRKIFEELKLPLRGKRKVRTAKSLTELDVCEGVVEIMGRNTPTLILVSDDLDFALIGVTTLELLGLEVDPVTGELKESIALLL